MSISLLRQLLMKEAVKKSAGSSGIMSINKNITKEVNQLLQKYINDALQQGVDLDTLSPEQLKMIVALNQPKPLKVYSGQEAIDQINKLFPKKGEVLPFKQKRSFKEEIDAMRKSGDIVDAEDIKISEKITDREMFKDANKRFKGPVKEKQDMGEFGEINVETDYSASIDRPEFFDPKAKNMYGEIVKTGDEFFQKERERILNTINRKKRDMVPPTHSNYKLLKKSLQDQEDALEAIKITEDLGGNENMFDFLRTKNISDYKSKPLQRSNYIKTDAEIKAEIEAGNKKGIEAIKKGKLDKPDDMATGGRAGYYTGGITDVKPNLSDIGHGSDSLMSRTRLMSPGSQATTSTGLNYLLAEDNDNIRVPFENGGDFKQFQKEKMMQLMQEYQQYLKNREIEKKQKPYLEKRMGTGPGPILEAAEGGRIGFAGGGDPRRRAFLKLLATLGGGAAAFKTGILGLGGKGAGKQVAKEVVKQSAGSGQPPPYFFKLVDKIKTMGDETLASQDNAIAKKYKDYVMEEDFAGNISIIKKNMDDPYPEEVIMSYKVDEVSLPNKKGMTKVDEYEEFTVRPDGDGKMKDIEPGVPDEVVNEGSVFEDNMTEFGMTKKADGGRIGLSGGGLLNVLSRLGITGSSRRFLEKAFGKKGFEEIIKKDPEMHRGLLEVVEMFRNRDKEGLKMYMQKFLPHMDDATVEEFIVGTTPDIEGLTGQLTRLGSGRDYAQKLQMMKKADEVKKLQDFDIKNVTKNAEGGRIEMKGGGDVLKAIIRYYANKKGVKGSTFLKDINPKILPEGIENILGPEQLKALQKNQTDYVESLLNIIKSDKKFLNNLKANTDEAIAQAPIGMEDFAKEITESIKRDAMKGSRFDRFKVYDKVDIDDAIVDVEQMIKNRRVKESDGRALNSLGGLQTMLGE